MEGAEKKIAPTYNHHKKLHNFGPRGPSAPTRHSNISSRSHCRRFGSTRSQAKHEWLIAKILAQWERYILMGVSFDGIFPVPILDDPKRGGSPACFIRFNHVSGRRRPIVVPSKSACCRVVCGFQLRANSRLWK